MKKYIKLLAVIGAAFLLSLTVNAEDITKTGYDYEDHTVSVNELNGTQLDEQELTVLIVKGDKTADDAVIEGTDIYFVDQVNGSAFSAFKNLGVKGGALEAGEYTIIAGGENIEQAGIKELFVVGNKEDKVPTAIADKTITYGEVRNVQITSNDNKYNYSCICDFDGNSLNLSKIGWIFQQKSGDSWQHLYKTIGNTTENDTISTSIDAEISIGLVIYGLPVNPAENFFTAIPCQVQD